MSPQLHLLLVAALLWSGWRLIFRRGAYPPEVAGLLKLKHFVALGIVAYFSWLLVFGIVWQFKNLGHLDELYAQSHPTMSPIVASLLDTSGGVVGVISVVLCFNAATRKSWAVKWLRVAVPFIAAWYAFGVARVLIARDYSVALSIGAAALMFGMLFGSILCFYVRARNIHRLFDSPHDNIAAATATSP